MRVPAFDKYVNAMRLAGVFLVGAIVGAAVLHSLFVAKFEANYNTVNALQSKLEQYKEDIEKLKLYKNQHTVIKSIQIRVLEEAPPATKLDRMTETELAKRLKKDLLILIGRSIYDIDAEATIARKLLENKTYEDVNGKDYRVQIKTVLLADNVLQVWMSASIKAKPPAS
jgi:hypothetical protein